MLFAYERPLCARSGHSKSLHAYWSIVRRPHYRRSVDAGVAIATKASALSAVMGAALNFKNCHCFIFFSLCCLCDGFGAAFSPEIEMGCAGSSRHPRRKKRNGILCAARQKMEMHRAAGAFEYHHHSISKAWLPCDDYIAICSV
jgi:hypothetical protein